MSSSPTSALPFLPGYRVELGPKDRYHKSHIFDLSNGIRVDMNKEKLDARGGQPTDCERRQREDAASTAGANISRVWKRGSVHDAWQLWRVSAPMFDRALGC
jgi:hypothetical protein